MEQLCSPVTCSGETRPPFGAGYHHGEQCCLVQHVPSSTASCFAVPASSIAFGSLAMRGCRFPDSYRLASHHHPPVLSHRSHSALHLQSFAASLVNRGSVDFVAYWASRQTLDHPAALTLTPLFLYARLDSGHTAGSIYAESLDSGFERPRTVAASTDSDVYHLPAASDERARRGLNCPEVLPGVHPDHFQPADIHHFLTASASCQENRHFDL